MEWSNVQIDTQASNYISVGKSKLRISDVENVVRDFYKDKHREGKIFSFKELGELIKIRRCPDYFCESFVFSEISNYALPFFKEESLKGCRDY